jgi:TrmH family RNA methyltransferase
MITSTSNAKIKVIRKLREKKERQASGLFYCEGLRIVGDAFDHQAGFDSLLIAPELLHSEYGQSLIEKAEKMGVPVLELDSMVFRSIAQKENPQGIAAVCEQRWMELNELDLNSGDLVVALDSVADPGNLGTIMRTLDGVGGLGLILLDQSTDPYDPTTMRASMGTLFGLHFIKTNLEQFGTWKHSKDIKVVGTSDKAQVDYYGYAYPDPMVLLMGSERQGLTSTHYALCDEVVAIPMAGSADSLNLAVATAVVMYEIFNQHRKKIKESER